MRLGKGPGCGKGPVLEKEHRLDRVAQAEDGRLAGLGEVRGCKYPGRERWPAWGGAPAGEWGLGGRHRLGQEPSRRGGGRGSNAETDIGWAWDNRRVDGPGWKRGISRWRGPARAGILPGNEGVCPG